MSHRLASDRANKYTELDIYNEPTHTAASGGQLLERVRRSRHCRHKSRGESAAPNVRMSSMNTRYADTTDGSKFANYYRAHTEQLRDAGFNAVTAMSSAASATQYYVNNAIETGDPNAIGANNGAPNAARIMQTIRRSTNGLAINLTAFGVKAAPRRRRQPRCCPIRCASRSATPTHRLLMGGSPRRRRRHLFAPAAALYRSTRRTEQLKITEAGKAWQDLLGIGLDGNPNKAWTTHVSQRSTRRLDRFHGFYGDYNIGNQTVSPIHGCQGHERLRTDACAAAAVGDVDTTQSAAWTSANWTRVACRTRSDKPRTSVMRYVRTIAVDAPQTVACSRSKCEQLHDHRAGTIRWTALLARSRCTWSTVRM